MINIEYSGQDIDIATTVREESDDWIIFIHGWGAQKECFDQAADAPALNGFSLCALDLVGFGESDKPESFSYSLEDQAAVTKLIIQSLQPRKAHIVGHSMGGGVGLLCATQMGNTYSNLISVEGNLVAQDTGRMARWIAHQSSEQFTLWTKDAVRQFMRIHPSSNYRTWAKWWDNASPTAIQKSAQSLVEWSDSGLLLPLFDNLDKKAYVYGENSKQKRKYILPYISKESSHMIKDSQHFAMLDNPTEFSQVIGNILLN